MKMKTKRKDGSSLPHRVEDARFASFETDPRFRLPAKRHTKTTIDQRFSSMLKDRDFAATAKVDRYGRKVKSDSRKRALLRLYRAEDDTASEKDGPEGAIDVEVDDDELVQQELRVADERDQKAKYDSARGGGFASSDSDFDSESNSDSEEHVLNGNESLDGIRDAGAQGTMQRFQDLQQEVKSGEVSHRLAVVNLDWDHVKSVDLMALFSSFLPSSSGQILKISIYPSKFGKERMRQEEIEGPPKALFIDTSWDSASSNDSSDAESDSSVDHEVDSESEDERIKKGLVEEGDDQDFDSDALRSYQLDRLRYYYAVVVCSNAETAKVIYDATDGTEYQASSNVIDLRFIPDDVVFDDEARDECETVPQTYKPVEFVTNALQSSQVKLTWDMHPEEVSRKASINRAFRGSRAELEENDLRAYLASDSDRDDKDMENDTSMDRTDAGEKIENGQLSKKALTRRKMREALGLEEEAAHNKKEKEDGPVGDMQITFAPVLAEDRKVQSTAEETTAEKYMRKERERKERKRQVAKAKRKALGDDGSESDADEDDRSAKDQVEDLGFDDPFFTREDPSPLQKTPSIRKEERRKKREAREAAEAESAEQKMYLSKAIAQDVDKNQAEHLDHFDMNEIVRAGKKKKKKEKNGSMKQQKDVEGDAQDTGLQEDFTMDVSDDRFAAVFDSHEFAIDPSNPKFKATGGMKKLLEEGRRKRKSGVGEESSGRGQHAKRKK